MPWQPRDPMDIKREFVDLALQPGANRRELCRRFNIGPKAAYAPVFERYGLPWRIHADNGSPWGTPAKRRPSENRSSQARNAGLSLNALAGRMW